MPHKLTPKQIVTQLKESLKLKPKPEKTAFNPVIKSTHRERDMRKEAMDMGAHQAKEIFGEASQNE